MQTNEFLKECKSLVDDMSYQQECCDYYLDLFNRNDLTAFYVEFIQDGELTKQGITFDPKNSTPFFMFKEFLQHAAEYHATKKRELDNQLEDLVKGRYLENSH